MPHTRTDEKNPSKNPPDESKNSDSTKNPYESEAANLKEFGQTQLPLNHKNPRGNIHFLNIIGQVEGHIVSAPQTKTTKYEHVIPQLVTVADDIEADGLLILLNTVGGDVEAGLAIAELISGFGKPTVSLVIGGGHSIGVPLAVASDYSFIAPSATMTIHPIRMSGLVVGAQQTFDYFQKMQDRVLTFIVRNSEISMERLSVLMTDTSKLVQDVGTILIGEEAVKEGLIDEVGGLSQALDKLYLLIEEKKEAENKKKESHGKKKISSSKAKSKT